MRIQIKGTFPELRHPILQATPPTLFSVNKKSKEREGIRVPISLENPPTLRKSGCFPLHQ